MPRYATFENVYVKDRVFFPEYIRFKYRKGKRVSLGFLQFLKDYNREFNLENFQDYLDNYWHFRYATINRPKPFASHEDYSKFVMNNAFDAS